MTIKPQRNKRRTLLIAIFLLFSGLAAFSPRFSDWQYRRNLSGIVDLKERTVGENIARALIEGVVSVNLLIASTDKWIPRTSGDILRRSMDKVLKSWAVALFDIDCSSIAIISVGMSFAQLSSPVVTECKPADFAISLIYGVLDGGALPVLKFLPKLCPIDHYETA